MKITRIKAIKVSKKKIKSLQKSLTSPKGRKKLVNNFHQNKLKLFKIAVFIFVISFTASLFTKKSAGEVELPEPSALQVKTFTVGEDQLFQDSFGIVKNLTSITLVAQTAGPVGRVSVTEGQEVKAGAHITSINSAYNTGSIFTVQRKLAQKNVELAQESLKNTVEIVSKNRELANTNRDNIEELRKISEDSIGGTRSLIDTTNQVIQKIEADISASSDADTIQALRQQLVSFKASLGQTEAALKIVEYNTDEDNNPTKLANISKDLIHKTTELQLKSAEIGRDIAWLNLKAARISEAMNRVSAPFSGIIEKIYIKPGQYLTPGTPVAKIKGKTNLDMTAYVSGNIAAKINDEGQILFSLVGEEFLIPITHVSNTPTQGQLFEVIADIPEELEFMFYEEQSLPIKLPLIPISTKIGGEFIPLDAVFITNTSRFVYVLNQETSEKRDLITGRIIGDKIEVVSGLNPGDTLILNRRVKENQIVIKISSN